MRITIIVAMTPEGLIGRAGGLPWHLPEDLQHFKRTTTGHAVVMGRKTLDSLGRALPKRRNLVVSRNPAPPAMPGVEWFTSLSAAIAAAGDGGETELFILGGAEIFREALPYTDRMIITFVHLDPSPQGDTFFPPWNPAEWQETERRASGPLQFVTFDRRR